MIGLFFSSEQKENKRIKAGGLTARASKRRKCPHWGVAETSGV